MSRNYDVAVVGGGFAGLTAARDLQRLGHRVVLLEARDRLGGRAHTVEYGGMPVELGGAWVHWLQPYVWSEMCRYGLLISETPEPAAATLFVDDQPHAMTVEALDELIVDAGDRIVGDTRAAFERPYDPGSWDLGTIDALSVADRIKAAEFDPKTLSAADSAYAGSASAYCSEVGVAPLMHWQALAGFDTSLAWECTERYGISSGATSLIDAIAADSAVEIRLESPVDAVEQSPQHVGVSLRDGQTVEARGVIVAVPVNTLGRIEFEPQLSSIKQAMVSEGQASHGFKVWCVVGGEMDEISLASSSWPVTDVAPHMRTPNGDTLCIAFGSDTSRLDPSSPTAVKAAVERLLPGREVLDTLAHDWTGDPFSLGTWSSFRPNQLTRYLTALQEPDARVILAGADVASGWNGHFDGAIESGIKAARRASRLLADD
jgi:pseudooxynicotine dehydrogenase